MHFWIFDGGCKIEKKSVGFPSILFFRTSCSINHHLSSLQVRTPWLPLWLCCSFAIIPSTFLLIVNHWHLASIISIPHHHLCYQVAQFQYTFPTVSPGLVGHPVSFSILVLITSPFLWLWQMDLSLFSWKIFDWWVFSGFATCSLSLAWPILETSDSFLYHLPCNFWQFYFILCGWSLLPIF